MCYIFWVYGELILSRRLDLGDYTPENSLWVNKTRNVVEAGVYYWLIKKPCGEILEIYNMSEFGKEHSYHRSSLYQVANGKYKGKFFF